MNNRYSFVQEDLEACIELLTSKKYIELPESVKEERAEETTIFIDHKLRHYWLVDHPSLERNSKIATKRGDVIAQVGYDELKKNL